MIHINRGDGKHEFLTKKEYEARYGQLPDTNGQLAEQAKSLRMARIEARVTLRELAKEMGVGLVGCLAWNMAAKKSRSKTQRDTATR